MLFNQMPSEVILQHLTVAAGKSVECEKGRENNALPSTNRTVDLEPGPQVIVQIFGAMKPFRAVGPVLASNSKKKRDRLRLTRPCPSNNENNDIRMAASQSASGCGAPFGWAW